MLEQKSARPDEAKFIAVLGALDTGRWADDYYNTTWAVGPDGMH
jgi:hypothetical protein